MSVSNRASAPIGWQRPVSRTSGVAKGGRKVRLGAWVPAVDRGALSDNTTCSVGPGALEGKGGRRGWLKRACSSAQATQEDDTPVVQPRNPLISRPLRHWLAGQSES